MIDLTDAARIECRADGGLPAATGQHSGKSNGRKEDGLVAKFTPHSKIRKSALHC